MNSEEKLKAYINENHIVAEHLHFNQSCHTVEEAAKAVNADPSDLVKNICLIDDKGNFIVAILKGEDRGDVKKIASTIGSETVRFAKSEEVLEKTGYPIGGVPSFGYTAKFLIDEKVMEKEIVYSGGGSDRALVEISTSELQRVNHGEVAIIRIIA